MINYRILFDDLIIFIFFLIDLFDNNKNNIENNSKQISRELFNSLLK